MKEIDDMRWESLNDKKKLAAENAALKRCIEGKDKALAVFADIQNWDGDGAAPSIAKAALDLKPEADP